MIREEEIIKKFKEETGYTLEYNNGKFSYGGSLDLRGTQIQSLPDNLTVGGNLYLIGTPIQSLPDNLIVGGDLYLKGTPITDTSIINWQTGEPKESGSYLVFIKGEFSNYTTCAMYNGITGWCHWKKEEITAWCKLSDIKPYKEGK